MIIIFNSIRQSTSLFQINGDLVDACCFEFCYVLKVVAKVREPVIITSSHWYIKCAFLGINSFEYITIYFWYFLCIYINRS